MNKDKYILSIILAAVSGLGCLVLVLMDAFAPLIVLPELDVPIFAAVSLVAVLIEYYFIKDKGERMWMLNFLLAAACFGFFPYFAGLATASETAKFAFIGAICFTAITFAFDSFSIRMKGKILAPAATAFCMFLAYQCFVSIFV